MVVGIECQHHVHALLRQAGIGLGALDELYVGQLVLLRRVLGFLQKIRENILAEHVALRSHRFAQVRQHVTRTGPDVRHHHARLERHGNYQFPGFLLLVTIRGGKRFRHRVAPLRSLVSFIGLLGDLTGGSERA